MDEVQKEKKSLLSGYGGGEEMPLGGYAALLGAWMGIFGSALVLSRQRLPRSLSTRDLLLTGITTHKVARIATRDWVTSPVRAPFTSHEKSIGSGEVSESSRGRGLRRGIGDLLTCPFCIGPWIAGSLIAGWVAAPRATRLVTSTFTVVTISDFLHHGYDILRQKAHPSQPAG